MPAGRPTKYDPDFCNMVVQLGREGASRAELAYEMGVSFQTMRTWEDTHPEFLEATTHARELAEGWWAAQGRKGIWSREFNAPAYRLQVMNRFPGSWRDKQDHEVTGAAGAPLAVTVTRRVVNDADG